MRLALPDSLALKIPLSPAMRLPRLDQAVIILIFMLGYQPFGSMASLLLFGAAMGLLILSTPMRAYLVVNWLCLVAYLGLVAWFLSLRIPINLPLFVIYFLYASALVATFHVLSRRMGDWKRQDLHVVINWILALDLAVNLIPVLVELMIHGFGDYITGLSGFLIEESLSQNRTYAVKAGCVVVLAIANFKAQRNAISVVSIVFNLLVMVVTVSVTTILAFMIALAAAIVFVKNPIKILFALSTLIPLAFAANFLNQALGSSDIFDMVLNVNTHYVPKIDLYKQYFNEMIAQYPWMPLFGNGFGNSMNRFAVLANFKGTSNFPGKEAFASLLEAPQVHRHLVDYYNLEKGIMGGSIISVPWSSLAGLIFEFGMVGFAFAVLLAWPALKRIWRTGAGSMVGSGRFLLVFLAGNLFWDCYLDYPEVMVPYFICLLAMVGLERRPSDSGPTSSV